MKLLRWFVFAVVLAQTPVFLPQAQGQVYYSKRNFVSNSVGFVASYVNGGEWRGSGCIVRDPRLVYSCAHVVYVGGLWATRYRFFPGYNSATLPSSTSAAGIAPRGYRYFTGYASSSNTYGQAAPRTFSVDFVVYYNATSFGTAIAWWPDGAAVLRSTRWKEIVGYPAKIDYTGANGYAYQHSTDMFTRAGSQRYGSYYGMSNVSTGGGNSGGPALVYDYDGSRWAFAGVLVSGNSTSCGIRANDTDSEKMATDALGDLPANQTRAYSNTSALLLPDGATAYSTRSVNAAGFRGNVQTLLFSTDISTTWRGDLDVYLVSPAGRIRWVSKQEGAGARNLVVQNADYSTNFRGYAANGRWDLKMRDASVLDRATFRSFSVRITAP